MYLLPKWQIRFISFLVLFPQEKGSVFSILEGPKKMTLSFVLKARVF